MLTAHENMLIVKRIEEGETKSKGGIVLPGSATKRSFRGRVVSAGTRYHDGRTGHATIREGEVVHYGTYVGVEVEFEKDIYWALNYNEILAVEK